MVERIPWRLSTSCCRNQRHDKIKPKSKHYGHSGLSFFSQYYNIGRQRLQQEEPVLLLLTARATREQWRTETCADKKNQTEQTDMRPIAAYGLWKLEKREGPNHRRNHHVAKRLGGGKGGTRLRDL